MFKKHLSLFRLNDSDKQGSSKFIPLIFDFATIAIISLSINSFIVDNHSSQIWQKVFSVFSVLIASMHWYNQNVYRDKYEKDSQSFRYVNLTMVFFMSFMAVGVSLLVLRISETDSNQKVFLKWFSLLLYLFGLIASSFLSFLQFLLAFIANNDNKTEKELIIFKLLSTFSVAILALVNFTLVSIFHTVELWIYTFMPAYFALEFIGSNLNVTSNRVKNYPDTLRYIKDRYKRLFVLFISSTFISLISQIGHYWDSKDVFWPLLFFIIELLIILQIYSLYTKIAFSGLPKTSAKNLIWMSILSPLMISSMTIFGGFLINSISTYKNLVEISLCFSFAVVYLTITLLYTTHDNWSKSKILEAIITNIITSALFVILGVLVIYVNIPMWSILATLLLIMIFDDILDRILVKFVFKES